MTDQPFVHDGEYFHVEPAPSTQPVYVVVWEGEECVSYIKGVFRSYDAALEAAKLLMAPYPECWKPGSRSRTWYYGYDSVSIEEYVLQGKP